MKILLMRPQSNLHKTIPLGLMYIAGYLRKTMPNVEVEIVDLRQNYISKKELFAIIEERSPDIVGVSAVSIEGKLTHSLIQTVKSIDKNIKVIIGGPYATSLPYLATKDDNVFCCVIGEGEETMRELVIRISNQLDISDVNGIAYYRNGKYNQSSPREFILDLDSIPMPAYDLINIKQYFRDMRTHSSLQAHSEYSSIFTSRGCPFNCTYCQNIFGKKIRFHSPERVIEEIMLLYHKYGVRELHIEDDCFNFNKKRVKEIANLIRSNELDIKFAFPNGIRADYVDEDITKVLKDMGTYRLAYGIESASLDIQKSIRKRLNLEVARKSIELTAKAGISTHGFFMLGFLGETKKEMLQTINFAKRSKLHTASFSFVIPQPGTQLYYEAVDNGYEFENIDTDQLNPGHTEINISGISTRELYRVRRTAYIKFYLNIGRIYRIYRNTTCKKVLLKGFFSFLNYLIREIALFKYFEKSRRGALWKS